MSEEEKSQAQETKPSQDSLPAGEASAAEVPKPTVEPIKASFTQNKLDDKNAEQKTEEELGSIADPIAIRVVEDKPLSQFENITLRFGALGILLAFLSFSAAVAAAVFVYQQFKEMSSQTELLSRAAMQSRRDANESSKTTAVQMQMLQKQLTIAQRGTIAIQGQLIQARRAADIASRQLETSQRAWISIIDESVPLIKFPNGGGLSINTQISYNNVGNLPATDVLVVPWTFLPDQTRDLLEQAKEQQRFVCARGRDDIRIRHISIAQTIYPGGKPKTHWWSSGMNTNGHGQVRANGGISPILVGCIFYRFNSSATIHETPFIFDVHRKLPNGQTTDLRLGVEVPSEDILVSDFWNGEATTDQP